MVTITGEEELGSSALFGERGSENKIKFIIVCERKYFFFL